MIVATLITPMFVINVQAATQHDASWYMNVSGVLSSDTYALYPFKTDKSLKWGFSKFGEMIDSINNIGLEYRDRDAFAPAAGSDVPSQILKHKWMQGWLINITYNNPVIGKRNVWAVAQHADLQASGYDWIRVSCTYTNVTEGPTTNAEEDPKDPGLLISQPSAAVYRGGRKTNGTASTEAIRVLYNGPRRFIARTVTHIYDWTPGGEAENEPLVDVVFTYIFNKDKKEVIVIKDIKEATTKFVFGLIAIPGDEQEREVNGAFIQFSNRGEWDIGPSPPTTPYFASYAHFYGVNGTNQLYTDYDVDYHLNPTLPRSIYSTYGGQPDSTGSYDLAQIISADLTYVGWAAFWPSLSNWHVDAGYQDKWWRSLARDEDRADRVIGPEPWQSPYIIGEWDFMLTKEPQEQYGYTFDRQFRGVTVYGLTDNWNGDDANVAYGHSNTIDREVQYQLDEEFQPWDLKTAVEKDTRRWVDFHTVTTSDYSQAQLGYNLEIDLDHSPVKYSPVWEQYCNFSERVEWGGARKIPARSVWSTAHYELSVDSDGDGTITIDDEDVPAVGTVIKILYSTYCSYDFGDTEVPLHTYTSTNYNQTGGTTFTIGSATNYGDDWTDPLGVYHYPYVDNVTFSLKMLYGNPTTNVNWTYTNTWTYWWWDTGGFKVWKDTDYWTQFEIENSQHGQYDSTTGGNASKELEITNFDALLAYLISTDEDIAHILYMNRDIDVTLSVTYKYYPNWQHTGKSQTWLNISLAFEINPVTGQGPSLYEEEIYGRYEWGVVGNHSRAIDSAGLSMVSAAFKNKQVEYGNGGLDVMDSFGTNVPYLLRSFGYTSWHTSQPSYLKNYDSIGRLHLSDDWCTRYPVTSSNIITVAGPMANIMSEYWNELTDAILIFGVPGSPLLNNVLFAVSCWNTTWASNYLGQYYTAQNGLAVITTYKDINGTVGFMIWGYSGDDTYYACKWFHEFGIYYIQHENDGVTTWILKLDYTTHTGDADLERGVSGYELVDNDGVSFNSHYPEVWRIERLGTISEKTPHDP